MASKRPVRVEPSPVFRRAYKRLQKRYRRIDDDVKPLIEQLQRGETPGDQIHDVAPHNVFKVRVKNTDAQRGKSGGYRVIYYLETAQAVILAYIYSKSDQADITASEIRQMIAEILDEASPPSKDE